MIRGMMLIGLVVALTGFAAVPRFAAGAWELRDGSVVGTPETRTVCMTGSDAESPGVFFSRELLPACTITRQKYAEGRIDVQGLCSPADRKATPEKMSLEGTWSKEAFTAVLERDVRAHDGKSKRQGTVEGRRTGDCT